MQKIMKLFTVIVLMATMFLMKSKKLLDIKTQKQILDNIK